MVPIASLLGTQHQGLVWGEDLATYWRHVQGVYLYVKLPHATETGSRTIGGMVLKATMQLGVLSILRNSTGIETTRAELATKHCSCV